MKVRDLVALVGALSSFGCAIHDSASVLGDHVSIIQLISNPERYDGKVVFLSAYATIEFEGDRLCMVPKPASSKDCVWLEVVNGASEGAKDAAQSDAGEIKLRALSGHRISIRGTLSKSSTGHLGGFAGALEKITDYYDDDEKLERVVPRYGPLWVVSSMKLPSIQLKPSISS